MEYDWAEHQTHHTHLSGTMSVCSCGLENGLVCLAITGDEPEYVECDVCGAPNVTRLGPIEHGPPPEWFTTLWGERPPWPKGKPRPLP